jgi:hypothetical protein
MAEKTLYTPLTANALIRLLVKPGVMRTVKSVGDGELVRIIDADMLLAELEALVQAED